MHPNRKRKCKKKKKRTTTNKKQRGDARVAVPVSDVTSAATVRVPHPTPLFAVHHRPAVAAAAHCSSIRLSAPQRHSHRSIPIVRRWSGEASSDATVVSSWHRVQTACAAPITIADDGHTERREWRAIRGGTARKNRDQPARPPLQSAALHCTAHVATSSDARDSRLLVDTPSALIMLTTATAPPLTLQSGDAATANRRCTHTRRALHQKQNNPTRTGRGSSISRSHSQSSCRQTATATDLIASAVLFQRGYHECAVFLQC